MNSKPPFVRQERPDTCAIACLRMILAYQGLARSEADVVQSAAMQPSGMDPEGLAQLAQRYGLHAVVQQLDREALGNLIRQQRFPIVFLYRRLINGVGEGHAVIPVRLSRQYVAFLDPLRGERRVTIRKFEEARRLVGQWVVVWEQPEA
jgi:ABC-type bacteriocin/lantibiotic exporter with double-glycine peptidase domain